MLLHTWLPGTLRSAGLRVVETPGWTNRSHGALPDNIKVVWHHDASPPGDSPGALNWMISNWDTSSANIWLDRYGTWHLVGTGVSWHAGRVLPGMPDNFSSIGIETDHTTAENWPLAQIDSLRKGTAAIFRKQAVDSSWLHFHKTICSPPGRKSDPDGLTLGPERAKVAALISGKPSPTPTPPTPTPPPVEEDDMPLNDADKKFINDAVKGQLIQYFANGEGNPQSGRIVQACMTALTNTNVPKRVWDYLMPRHSKVVDGKEQAVDQNAQLTVADIASDTAKTRLGK
jgi:hypothetical protein